MSRPWGIGVSECRIYNEIEAINQKQASMFNKAKVGNVITAKVYVTKEDMIKKVVKDYKIKEKICEHIADAICIADAIGQDYLIEKNII